MQSELDLNIGSGIPPVGTTCSCCGKSCQDEGGVYAYAGQLTPKPFCSNCRQAALDYATTERKRWLKSYSQHGIGFDVTNFARRRSGGRTKRTRSRSKKPTLSRLEKLLAAGIQVDEV